MAAVEIAPLHKQLIADVRVTVLVLWGAVGLVMLLACVNVASLMISRTLARQREMAVRAAVGARRWQLIRQLLTESVLVGLAGGALGLLIAVWGTRAIGSLVPKVSPLLFTTSTTFTSTGACLLSRLLFQFSPESFSD